MSVIRASSAPGSARTLLLTLVFGLLTWVLTATGAATPASAHAYILDSTPANGATVSQSPEHVTVRLSEPVTFVNSDQGATVLDSHGNEVQLGSSLDASRTTVAIDLPPDLPDDVYVASWTIIAADTHVMGGSLQFGVNVPAGQATQSAEADEDQGNASAVGLAKGAVHLGLALGLGIPAALLVLQVPTDRLRLLRRISRTGLVVAVLATILQFAAQLGWVLQQSSGGGASVSLGIALETLARSGYGVALGARLVLLLVLWSLTPVLIERLASPAAHGRSDRPRRRAELISPAVLVWLAAALGVAATEAAVGHGATSALLWTSTMLHVLAASGWVGGLVVLAFALLRHRLTPEELRGLPRWTLYATMLVSVVIATGLVQAVRQVGALDALTTTTYGIVLLVKLLLVAITLSIGAAGTIWSWRERRRADERPAPGRTARLRRRTILETGVGLSVLVLSGLLSSLAPASATYRAPVTQSVQIGPYTVSVSVDNARVGPQVLRVDAVGRSALDAPPRVAGITLSSADGQVQEISPKVPFRVLGAVGPGVAVPVTFQSEATNVPLTGEWQATLRLEVDDLHQYVGVVTYDVAP